MLLGKPTISFEGKALEISKKFKVAKAHLSISHEEDYAVSFVLLEKTAEKDAEKNTSEKEEL